MEIEDEDNRKTLHIISGLAETNKMITNTILLLKEEL